MRLRDLFRRRTPDHRLDVLVVFRLLLERAPGTKELNRFLAGLDAGEPVAWAVHRAMGKPEVAERFGDDDRADVVLHRALDRAASGSERSLELADLVVGLVGDPQVRARFSVDELDAPRGVDPLDAAAYRRWLEHHRSWRAATAVPGGEDLLTVIAADEPWQQAVSSATTAFVTLLAPGAELDPDAAAWLAPHADADAEVLLSDGDASGRDPVLDAAWDPDLAAQRPPAGLVAVRRQRAATCDPDGDPWALLLQATRDLDPDAVRHVPGVLLHGRQNGPLKRVHRPLPEPPPVTVVVPTRDRADLLERCLTGLLDDTDYAALEVLVLDNESVEPETAELLDRRAADPRLRVVAQPGAFNWSAFNNRGVALAQGEVVVLLNNDAVPLHPDWLTELVSHAVRPDVGIVGAKLLYENGTVQHAGMSIGPAARTPHLWRFEPDDAAGVGDALVTVRTVGAVTGACLALRRDVFEEVHGLEDTALKVTYSDVDLCLRVRAAGYRVVWTPHARLTHIANATRDTTTPEEKPRVAREREYLVRTWGEWADADPYLSPFLVNRDGPPLLAWRPRRGTTPHA